MKSKSVEFIGYLWAKVLKKIRGSALKNVFFGKDSKVESGCHLINVVIGKHSFCGYDCEIYNCEIGNFTSIANYVRIGGSKHPYEWVSTSPVFYNGKDSVKEKFSTFNRDIDKTTYIGNDVWIGEGCFIKAGVIIGDGAVIGMGSVVTRNVEPYAIVAGNPAKLIKYRFEKCICDRLEMLCWWEWSDEEIREASKYVQDVKKFLEFCYEKKSKVNEMEI